MRCWTESENIGAVCSIQCKEKTIPTTEYNFRFPVGIDIGHAASAVARPGLGCILGALVQAIGGAVTVGVVIGGSASAVTRLGLGRVLGALVQAVGGTVTVGVVLMLLQIGIMNGMITQMLDNNISTKLGHITISKKGFFDDMKLESNFYPDPRVLEKIGKKKNVVAVAPRIKAFAMIRTSEASRGVIVMGIYPDREKKISKINEYTLKEEGSRYLDDPASNDILISKSLADKLDVYVGDKIVLLVQDEDSEMTGVGLTVKERIETLLELNNQFYAGNPIALSIGLATCTSGAQLEQCVQQADRAMYEEKARFYNKSAYDRRLGP